MKKMMLWIAVGLFLTGCAGIPGGSIGEVARQGRANQAIQPQTAQPAPAQPTQSQTPALDQFKELKQQKTGASIGTGSAMAKYQAYKQEERTEMLDNLVDYHFFNRSRSYPFDVYCFTGTERVYELPGSTPARRKFNRLPFAMFTIKEANIGTREEKLVRVPANTTFTIYPIARTIFGGDAGTPTSWTVTSGENSKWTSFYTEGPYRNQVLTSGYTEMPYVTGPAPGPLRLEAEVTSHQIVEWALAPISWIWKALTKNTGGAQ